MEAKGRRYTWSNGADNGLLEKASLDRALVNLVWRTQFPRANFQILPAMYSEHYLILLDFNDE